VTGYRRVRSQAEGERVRLYWHVASTTMRRLTAYRGATVAGIFTNTVFGYLIAYVTVAVFRQRPAIGGYDVTDAVTFTFVTQGLLMVVGMFGDTEMAERVRTGDVAVDLSRPYDFQGWWAATSAGRTVFFAAFRSLPPFLFGSVAFHLRLPAEPWVWPAFVLSAALAAAIGFAWGFLLQLSVFWVLDVRGPLQIGWITANVLSGMLAPLVLLPDGLERVVRLLPFASLIQVPVEVFLGKSRGLDLVGAYALQVAWVVALVALGRGALARAERRVVVQGG
jgi:ABC-2 type transport system permease protein